jgi:hypothetical protein
MKVRVNAQHLAEILNAACRSKLRQECLFEALQDRLTIHASDGANYFQISIPATVEETGKLVVYAPMLVQLLKSIGPREVTIFPHHNMTRLVVQLGDEAQYLLPLGFRQDEEEDDDPLRARATELMNEAAPVIAFKSPNAWQDCSNSVKPYRGEWEFSNIWVVPLRQQPEWAMAQVVAAIVATDQTILAASLLTAHQAEVLTDKEIILFVPPELTALPIRSFALASKEDKSYIYAILDDGFVCAPTDMQNSGHYYRVVNNLLFTPAHAQLRFNRATWQHLKKAIQTYADKKVSRYNRSAIARWDILPDGSHYIWSSTEQSVLFTADKAEVIGEIPRPSTFWTTLLEKAIKFVPTPSVIELIFQENTCMMRLHDQFNYRICALMSMVFGSDYESFTGSSEREMQDSPVTPETEDETEVGEYVEV